MASFHDVLFPLDVSLKARGGPERRTQIVALASGREQRIARWAHSRRRYEAGYGVKSLQALANVVAFFEERRGRLYGFRWRDRADWKSCALADEPAALDQTIGQGDGVKTRFQLCKTYGAGASAYRRAILKPVAGSLRVAIDGALRVEGVDYDSDAATGLVAFRAGKIPRAGATVSAGFLFDVPVRFDTDFLEIDHSAFEAGAIPKIPLVEIHPF